MTIRTRFAPSPTGYLHIGGVRTALFCYLYARRHQGQFVLRIEDTDLARSTPESVQAILDGMEWLGLTPDEGPFYQTQRFDRYKEVVQQLLAEGHAYRCYCTREELDERRKRQIANKENPRYDGRCRERSEARDGVDPVVRFRNPQAGAVVIDDLVQGKVTISNAELDDLIIARSDGTPTYNLTVVVDDIDMHITHVIRGDDHLNNTPRQINIMRALGDTPPQYAHVPMILGADGGRLSKRHGAVSVLQYRDDGFLPDALLNYLVRLGWSHGDQEIFSRAEMIELFDIADVNRAASVFNVDKLLWLNHQYIQSRPPEDIAPHLAWHMERSGIDTSGGPALTEIVSGFKERARTLLEMVAASRFIFEEFGDYEPKAAKKNLNDAAREPLNVARDALAALAEWDDAAIHGVIHDVAGQLEVGMGKVAQPLRVAATGTAVSPPIDATLRMLGRERTLARIDRALAHID